MLGMPLHTVVETPEFRRHARRLLTDGNRSALVDHLAANPDSGDSMPGTGGARKLRWAIPGKGKRGSLRVVTFYSGPPVPVFLLTVFGKGERVDLSMSERNELRRTLGDLVTSYLSGVRRNVKGR